MLKKLLNYWLKILSFILITPLLIFGANVDNWKDQGMYKPNPIIFLHGFAKGKASDWENINSKLNQYFKNYSDTLTFLETIDFNDPNGSIDTYDNGDNGWADKVKDRINELLSIYKFKNTILKINIISHSMGGLAAREYASNQKYGSSYLNIDKIIAIGTPHCGTPTANVKEEAINNVDKIIWELPGVAHAEFYNEFQWTDSIMQLLKGELKIEPNGEAVKDMAIGSKFIKNLNGRIFPVNIKNYVILGKVSSILNWLFFRYYYENDSFSSGDWIVPVDSQKGYDIFTDYPNSSKYRWVWKVDKSEEISQDHFTELNSEVTVQKILAFLDSTPPEFTLDTPQENSTTEINTDSISIQGRVYKEYLPADSEIIISGVRQEDGDALNQINAPLLKPSSLWIPNNPDSPVAEFDETIPFPGEGTYRVSCQIKNPAGLTSDIKVFWVKVVLVQPNANIIVHCHNPEEKEIGSIQGVKRPSVEIYDGATLIGYGAHNADTHGKPISIPSGNHTIKAKFNGMVLEQDIDIAGGTTQELTFTFVRTIRDLASMLNLSATVVANTPYPLPPFNQTFFCDASSDQLSVWSTLYMIPELNHLDGMYIIGNCSVTPSSIRLDIEGTAIVSGPQNHTYDFNARVGNTRISISWLVDNSFAKWFVQDIGPWGPNESPLILSKIVGGETISWVWLSDNILPTLFSIPASQDYNLIYILAQAKFDVTTSSQVITGSSTNTMTLRGSVIKISSVPYDLLGTAV